MKILRHPARETWSELCERPLVDLTSMEKVVGPILERVREEGDKAIKDFTRRFDKFNLSEIRLSPEERSNLAGQVGEPLKKAIQTAHDNIEKFHRSQLSEEDAVETLPGVLCWRKSVPIEKVGLYIPGGTAPLFSTILMLAIPARLAGCREIILCTPPSGKPIIHPAMAYAADLAGITDIYLAGGAQAIGAMAYGTQTIPAVYKIFGPGNQYVTAAKQLVNKDGVAIDMPAGPSELAVIAGSGANAAYIAADLLSQAEHGPDSQVILVSDSDQLITDTLHEVRLQIQEIPRREVADKAMDNSKFVLVKDMNEAVDLVNRYAPEHLIIAGTDNRLLAGRIINAGSVFLGNYTPEAAGDYASGTNHTLPTNGFARMYSGVSCDSFVKKVTFQEISSEGLKALGPVIEEMAAAESLEAHRRAVSIRLKDLS